MFEKQKAELSDTNDNLLAACDGRRHNGFTDNVTDKTLLEDGNKRNCTTDLLSQVNLKTVICELSCNNTT